MIVSAAENMAQFEFTGVREEEPGILVGDPFSYFDGCTTAHLRSGVDGPHSGLADQLCNLNGRLYE